MFDSRKISNLMAKDNTAAIYEIDDEIIFDILSSDKNDFLLYLLGWLRREGIDIDHYRLVKIIEGLAYRQEKKR